ncbi:MAG TPA: CYTH and CHAD domain-containing protein [Azospirillaceae bacterium]|nr:CYTH and CHAD domain-containing protein [Azospirillaceae bacterium]
MTAQPANTETELKLAVRPDDLRRLKDAPPLAGAARATARTLDSVYYDTPDQELGRRRVTLRVRRQGQAFVQTLKSAADPAEGLARGEWEWPLAGPEPNLARIDDVEARELLGRIDPAALKPLFTCTVKRAIKVIDHDAAGETARVEVAFDTGEIRTPEGAAMPVSEVELELKAGEPVALYDLALRLHAVAPVRLEIRTKAARGYALSAGTVVPGAVKAGRLTLKPDITVEGAMARIMRACAAQIAANEGCAVDGRDPEGIHQMRVALRRLRSALSVFADQIPADQLDLLVGEVKWLAGSLGAARDWDVFREELLAPVHGAFADQPGLAADLVLLNKAAEEAGVRGYAQAREAILSPRYTALLLRLGAWVEGRAWRDQPTSEDSAMLFQPVTELADRLLAKRHRKARKTGTGFDELSSHERHQVRIALKKLRYAVEFFQSLYDEKPVRRYGQEMAELQDALGHLNDVATATRLLARLHEDGHGSRDPEVQGAERRAAGIVIGWHARGLVDMEQRLCRDWERFADSKPFWSKPNRMA